MPAVTAIDLTAIPEDQREAVAALLRAHLDLKDETAGHKDSVRRQEHLVAELNQVVHGKRSEKLSEDARQLAFEDLETAVAEVEAQTEAQGPARDGSRRNPASRRNRGH